MEFNPLSRRRKGFVGSFDYSLLFPGNQIQKDERKDGRTTIYLKEKKRNEKTDEYRRNETQRKVKNSKEKPGCA